MEDSNRHQSGTLPDYCESSPACSSSTLQTSLLGTVCLHTLVFVHRQLTLRYGLATRHAKRWLHCTTTATIGWDMCFRETSVPFLSPTSCSSDSPLTCLVRSALQSRGRSINASTHLHQHWKRLARMMRYVTLDVIAFQELGVDDATFSDSRSVCIRDATMEG